MFVVLILLVIAAWIFVPGFAQGQTLVNLVTNNWYIVILGIGVTFLLITKNFDLSVGGIVALTGVLTVYFSQAANVSQNELANGLGFPYPVAVVLALRDFLIPSRLSLRFLAR
jgi:ribose transport system permease protein